MDFALWKAAKPGEPAWDSPWGAAVRAGTSSARRCRWTSSARASISTAAATTSCSRTTRTSAPRPRRPGIPSPATGSTRAWSRSAARRCRSRSATSRPWSRAHSPTDGPAAPGSRCCRRHYRRSMDLGRASWRRRRRASNRLGPLRRRAPPRSTRLRRRPPTVEQFRAAMDDDFNRPMRMAVGVRGRVRPTGPSTTRDPAAGCGNAACRP